MNYTIYLAGEIHTNWREQFESSDLPVKWLSPVTDHSASDDCGAAILGSEDSPFWHDHKGAKMNAIRTQNMIKKSDIVVVKFGEKYRQWNAAFDTGYAAALGKSIIVIHPDEFQHALKELDASANVVTDSVEAALDALRYIINGSLPH